MTFHNHLWRTDEYYQFGYIDQRFIIPKTSPPGTEIAECGLHFAPAVSKSMDKTVVTFPEPRMMVTSGFVSKDGFHIPKPLEPGQVVPDLAKLPFSRCEGLCTIHGIAPVIYCPWALRSEAQMFLAEQYVVHLREEIGTILRLIEQIARHPVETDADKVRNDWEDFEDANASAGIKPGPPFPTASLPKGWG